MDVSPGRFQVVGATDRVVLAQHHDTAQAYYFAVSVWDGHARGSPWAAAVVRAKVEGGEVAGVPGIWLPRAIPRQAVPERVVRRQRVRGAEAWRACWQGERERKADEHLRHRRAPRASDYRVVRESGKAVLVDGTAGEFWLPGKVWRAFGMGQAWAAKWIATKEAAA